MTKIKDGFYKQIAGVTGDNSYVLLGGGGHKLESNLSVASAGKLTTTKSIWGQSFDGTANVSGNMTSVGNISFSASGKNIGSILYFDTTNSRLGVGTSSPSYKLHVVGDIYTTTGFKKANSSNSYVLLGGGGHKLESNLNVNYASLAGTITGLDDYNGLIDWSDAFGENNEYSFPSEGLRIGQWNDESSGIVFSGDGIYMWAPPDNCSLAFYSDDDGDDNEVWSIDGHGNFSGNASTATTLQTSRTINGTSFNGSQNITITPSLPISGNTIAVKVGDQTSSYITVPYASNANKLDNIDSTGFFRYEGRWYNNDSDTHNVDDAEGMIFAYNRHGTPDNRNWGILSTFTHERGSGYKMQLFSDGYNDGYTYYRNKSTDREGWGDWIRFIDTSNWTSIIDGRYVKLDAGANEQTIKNSISSLSNGSIEIWRAVSGGYPMIGFSNGTSKTKLGLLGFGSKANEPIFRNTSGTDYKLAHAGNVSNKNATIGTTLTEIATIAGISIKANIGSYASSSHNHNGGAPKLAWGQQYVDANGTLTTISGNMSGVGNIIPDGNSNTKNLGSSAKKWAKLYIGGSDSYGSATQGIYWNAGVPTAMTYSLNATVNSSGDNNAGTVAYYSGTNTISSATKLFYDGSLWVGETTDAQERDAGVRSVAGTLYMFAQNSSTGYRGLYANNNRGSETSVILIDKDNNITFNGYLNGTASSASSATNANNIKTVARGTNANHYLTFVDSNNSTATYEALYTQNNLYYNPDVSKLFINNLYVDDTIDLSFGKITWTDEFGNENDGGPYTFNNSGLTICQHNDNDETSGIQLTCDVIRMWCPANGNCIEFYDEDDGELIWSIDSDGLFSGSCNYASRSNLYQYHNTTTNNIYVMGSTTSNSGYKGTFYTRGEFYFTNSGAYHTSDARKKYDIRDILYDDVSKLFDTDNGFIRHFKWKESDIDSYGFIAQELQEYCPEAVDFNNDDGFYAVNYNVAFSKIIGAMFKKIKELERKLQKKENH